MNIGIIQFPGSNCEQETRRAVRAAGMNPVDLYASYHANPELTYDGYIVIGGFSYEDRSRAGVIAAHTPIMKALKKESEAGKPILGICNGAQVLVESGLVPGLKNYPVAMALDSNVRKEDDQMKGTGYYNRWVNICSTKNATSAFVSEKTEQPMYIPIAHAEGRFVVPTELLRQMKSNNLVVFQYCTKNGQIVHSYPTNPNGSLEAIAGIGNARGNVLALMPHPERTANGQSIFDAMRQYIISEKKLPRAQIQYKPTPPELNTEPWPIHNIITRLIITDNHAVTVSQTARKLGIKSDTDRYTLWTFESEEQLESVRRRLIDSSLLHNSNKECIVDKDKLPDTGTFLRIDHMSGNEERTLQAKLTQRKIPITTLKKHTLWHVKNTEDPSTVKKISELAILANPISQQITILTPMNTSPSQSAAPEIHAALDHCLKQTDFVFGKKIQGKVRDRYEFADKIIMITTDRQSAFDRILASVPYKGQVLNLVSQWWFEKTRHIMPNHMISVPHPNVMVVKKCNIFPVEFVMRGYLTGSTSTSAWVNYEKGARILCGANMPDGMMKNQKFPAPIITPTTKGEDHDELISPAEIVARGLMSQKDWDEASGKARELFAFGQKTAFEHGLILVDTKYEMGKDEDGNIVLVDEIHTPDSSRYWIESSYHARFAQGLSPEHIDKEFLRLWFTKHCDPYNDEVLPAAPTTLVAELASRYVTLYQKITGKQFIFKPYNFITQDIQQAVQPYIQENEQAVQQGQQVSAPAEVIILMGSEKDRSHGELIAGPLKASGIKTTIHVGSAHKQAPKVLSMLEENAGKPIIYITIAGRSNALSGFVAGHSKAPVIACPPHKDTDDYMVNIHSTLQMPSNVPVLTILDPANCVLAVQRLLFLYG